MLINKPLILSTGTGVAPAFTIDQSIRFNDDDSAQMSRTPSSSSTSQRAFSISMWVKRGNLTSGNRGIISWEGANDNNELRLYFDDDALVWWYYPGSDVAKIITNRLFRDVSAWYHILVVSDTENAVSNERWRMYINGQRETSFSSSTFPSQNTDIALFSSTSYPTRIGKARSASPNTFDGYLAEIVVIDGQALDPSSFGLYNDSNIWIPKDVSGLTFGTNGFHIDGRDSADLGDDESGNGNDFTTSGLASNDQVADSPTNNFAVLSPIDKGSMTLSEGNLKGTSGSGSVWQTSKATIGVKSGKWYWEVRAGGTTYNLHGTVGLAQTLNTTTSIHPGVPSDGYGWYGSNGAIYHNGSQIATESTYTTGDIISFALDLDDSGGILTAYKNGVSEGNLTTTYKTADTDDFIFPAVGLLVSDTCIINFGQDGTFAGNVTAGGNSDGNGIGNFKYSVPSGYLALCTKNLGS
jgi:hypothetical protein